MSTGTHQDLRSKSRVTIDGGKATITLDVRGRVGEFRDDVKPEISIVEASAEPRPIEVTHVAPGLYTAQFPIEKYGEFYRMMVVQRQGAIRSTCARSPSPRATPPSSAIPFPTKRPSSSLPRILPAVFDPKEDQFWKFEGEPGKTPQDTWWWWLVAAAILLPIDIAVRRLGT